MGLVGVNKTLLIPTYSHLLHVWNIYLYMYNKNQAPHVNNQYKEVICLQPDGHPIKKWLFQLDDEPNLYIMHGEAGMFIVISKKLMTEIRRSPAEVGGLYLFLKGFIVPRWCKISSINSITDSSQQGYKIVKV